MPFVGAIGSVFVFTSFVASLFVWCLNDDCVMVDFCRAENLFLFKEKEIKLVR